MIATTTSVKLISGMEASIVNENKAYFNFVDDLARNNIILNIKSKSIVIRGFETRSKVSYRAIRGLYYLWKNINTTCDRYEMTSFVWNDEKVVSNNLNVIISELRLALDKSELTIINVRCKGYKLVYSNMDIL